MIRPEHYKNGSIECWDVMRITFGDEAFYWFCILNAFKYIWRYQEKDGKRDLEKARTYLDKAEDGVNFSRDPDWVNRLASFIDEKMYEYKEG